MVKVLALRLGRRSLLLALVGSTCVLASHASAAPAPTLFKLTIFGTAHQEWTYSAAPVTENGCTRTETSEGIRSASFRTGRPITVRILRGKVLPVTIGGIRGTVSLGGANTTDERCGAGGVTKTADCAPTRRAFSQARLKARSTRPGVVSVDPVANLRLRSSDCPVEPTAVIRRPLGPIPKLLGLPREVLREDKLARITVVSRPRQRTTFGSPERGRLEESAEWMLTFVRIRG